MERNRRILIVDDQEDLREQLAKLLISSGQPNKTATLVQSMRARLMGLEDSVLEDDKKEIPQYDIDTAGQGEEAFEMVKAAIQNGAPYAVMLTDMRMPPGWDGLKTAKKAREVDKNLEIVIMTAYADHGQDEISREIGTPEKLLYIKKPFQAEEIFQLALSLTSKWNFEELERTRRKWLEDLIRCMRKVKLSYDGKNLFPATLEALLSFTESTRGFIATWSEDSKSWTLRSQRGVETEEAETFITKNSSSLYESDTIQKDFHGQYLIPLKSHELSAVVIIYDAKTFNDQEWYKLMNLLVMTSNENLENVSFKEKQVASNTDSRNIINIVRQIREDAEILKKRYEKEKDLDRMLERVDKVLESMKR